MNKKWPTVRLGDVVLQERESVGSFDGDGLPVLGVTNIEGVTQTGVEASDDRSKYLRLRPGRFVYNPYRINVGSIGLSSETQDGICSPAYVVFAPREQLDAKFLRFFLRSVRGNQLINFHGNRGSVRSALRFDDFADIEIPLPPLEEQRRVVGRIEELTVKINDARHLRHETTAAAGALTAAVAKETFSHDWKTTELGRVCSVITDGTHQTPRYVDEGAIFLSAQNVKPFCFKPENHRKVSFDDFRAYTAHNKPRRGDVLLTRVGAGIGEAAVIDRDIDFAIYVSIALIRTDGQQLAPEFLVYWLNSPFGQDLCRRNTLGKGHSQGNLNLKLLRGFRVPIPPLTEQRRMVGELDDLRAKVGVLKDLQSVTAVELDALLPSILAKAFGGEL